MPTNPKHSQPSESTPERILICPFCNSQDVSQTGGGSLGGEVYFSVICNQCKEEDTLDIYQQGRWLRESEENTKF